ncbi:MAG TPA: hypothetical protein VJR89_07315 [Polyangiales bacterium]|nr:hypothetical protein [Polyangiales bacterium]
MTAWIDAGAFVVSVFGLAVLVLGTARGLFRPAVHMTLTLWMAAGLMRLSSLQSWQPLVAAAAIVLIRNLVSRGLRHEASRPSVSIHSG